jgi:hypothetical protein
MINNTSPKKRFLIFLVFILIFIVLIPVLVLYSIGYRLDKGLELTPTGGIYIYHPQSGMSVSVKGDAPQTTSFFSRNVLFQNLKPGTYEIDAWKTGYSYWKKNITVKEEQVAEAYPFFILEPVATTTLATTTRMSVDKLFTSTSTPPAVLVTTWQSVDGTSSTSVATTTLRRGGILERSVYLYTDVLSGNKNLIASWQGKVNAIPHFFCKDTNLCSSSIAVTNSWSKIKHFDFYPGRYDVAIYSNDDGVFVTELDKREPQNFVTLVKGKVDFRLDGGYLYIKDTAGVRPVLYELLYE